MRASFTQRHLLSLFFLILLATGTVLAGPGDRNRDRDRDKDNYTFSKIRQNAFGLRFGPTSGLVYTRYIGADQGLDLLVDGIDLIPQRREIRAAIGGLVRGFRLRL